MADKLTDQQIADAIAVMDARWAGLPVRCQCPGEPHGEAGCRSSATVKVERHLIGQCDGPEANEYGNRIELLCLQCARDLWLSAHKAIDQLKKAAAQTGMVPLCTTCQAPLARPSDIVRAVERNDKGIR